MAWDFIACVDLWLLFARVVVGVVFLLFFAGLLIVGL